MFTCHLVSIRAMGIWSLFLEYPHAFGHTIEQNYKKHNLKIFIQYMLWIFGWLHIQLFPRFLKPKRVKDNLSTYSLLLCWIINNLELQNFKHLFCILNCVQLVPFPTALSSLSKRANCILPSPLYLEYVVSKISKVTRSSLYVIHWPRHCFLRKAK